MPAANLQTVIVAKRLASTRTAAAKLAQPHAKKIYTSRQTERSWRFRQRPPGDFVEGSFRTYHVPGHPGITLVYGKLKQAKNPKGGKVLAGRQRHLRGGGEALADINRDWDFWLDIQDEIAKANSKSMLQVHALSTRMQKIQSPTIMDLIRGAIADRARELRLLRTRPSSRADEYYYNVLVGDVGNPTKRAKKKVRKKVAKKRKKKAAKKRSKKPGYIKLKDPKVMPDPGPSGWLGSSLEFSVKPNGGRKPRWAKLDEKGNWLWEGGYRKEWLFLWSPKYKAVVGIKRPRGLKGGPGRAAQTGQVIRDGRGAKMFEVFSGRSAEQTQEIEVTGVPLKKWGDSIHYVYRADKWEPGKRRKTTDYIHDLGAGVKIYCGPTIEKPQVFLCFGGKLTLTERGLVF